MYRKRSKIQNVDQINTVLAEPVCGEWARNKSGECTPDFVLKNCKFPQSQQKCVPTIFDALQIKGPVWGQPGWFKSSSNGSYITLKLDPNQSIDHVHTMVSAPLTAALDSRKTVTDYLSVIRAITILKVKCHQWLQYWLLFWCFLKLVGYTTCTNFATHPSTTLNPYFHPTDKGSGSVGLE